MRKILVTGGSVFVSKFIASYFVNNNDDVYVLNRGNHEQVEGVTFIQADRHHLNGILKEYAFDVVIDVCAYNKVDVKDLINKLGQFKDYILMSSSAVYPEILRQPFHENQDVGYNTIWQQYGKDKIEAEQYLQETNPQAYIIRPPYLYGPMQNVYRETFVFECAIKNRPFYIPKDGKMQLQFFHVEDLCKLIDEIIKTHPQDKIYNVGNEECVDINEFVDMCYQIVGNPLKKVYVSKEIPQRSYFSFHDYEYRLDITKQKTLLPQTKDLFEGLKESYKWYIQHQEDTNKKDYIEYIDRNLA